MCEFEFGSPAPSVLWVAPTPHHPLHFPQYRLPKKLYWGAVRNAG